MLMKRIAAAAAVSIAAMSSAHALTVSDYDSPIAGGEAGQANAIARQFESFEDTTLSFTAADFLRARTNITINPFERGSSANSIELSYAINDGDRTMLDIIRTPAPFPDNGASGIGASFLEADLRASDTLSFFINGLAGQSGNQVTFSTTTAAIPLPAAGLLYLAGIGGVIAVRRKRKAANA